MVKTSFLSITAAARNVFSNWRSVVVLAVVYAALLAALYTFVVVREASMLQVALTFVLALAAPLLFFWLQSMIVGIADRDRIPVSSLLRRSLGDLWKIIVVSIPLIALAVLVGYLLMKAQTRWGATLPSEADDIPRRAAAAGRDPARPVDWKNAGLSSVRYLIFGLVLPLAAIHVWLVTARDGLGPAIKRAGRIFSRAFSPQSVLIYVVGFIVFGVIPYFILFKSTTSSRAWLDVSLLTTRLVLVFALTLLGWVITIKALSLSTETPPLSTDKTA